MKLNFQSFVILCSVCLCAACGNSSVNTNTEDSLYKVTIRLPDMDTLQDLYLSEIADSVYYVALSEKPFLGEYINHLETTDNSIVLQGFKSPLTLYDLDGNFKRKIGDIGRGAGEYLYPEWTVTKTDTVYLMCPVSRRDIISVYSLSDDSDDKMIGSLKSTTSQPITGYDLYSLGHNILVRWWIDPQFSRELILYNPQTNTIIDSLPNYHNGGSYENGGYSHAISAPYKDERYYMNTFSDTLYRVTDKEITPFAIFDLGKYKLPIKVTTHEGSSQFFPILKNSIIPKSIFRTSSMLYVMFQNGRNMGPEFNQFIYAFNLDDKTGRYCKTHFINDLDNGPNYRFCNRYNKPQTSQIINISTLKITPDQKLSEWVFPKNKMTKKMKNIDEFQRLFDKSTEESNPIIQFLKFKE